MAPQSPIVTSEFVTYPGERRSRDLSLAVALVDEVTGTDPAGQVRVFLKEDKAHKAIRNLSGHYCFVDVEDGSYTLVIETDRVQADWYFMRLKPGEVTDDFERVIEIPNENGEKFLEVRLPPKPSYPFPITSTLIRGDVVFSQPPPPPPAKRWIVVSTEYQQVDPADPDKNITKSIDTRSDDNDAFILFFTALPQDTQTQPPQDKQKVTLQFTVRGGGGGSPQPQTVEIEQGKTTTIHVKV